MWPEHQPGFTLLWTGIFYWASCSWIFKSGLFWLIPFSLFISKYYFPLPLLSPRKACGFLPHACSFWTVGHHYPDIQTLHPSPSSPKRMILLGYFILWCARPILGSGSSRCQWPSCASHGFQQDWGYQHPALSWEQSKWIHPHSKPLAPTESTGGGTGGKKMHILGLLDHF